LAQAHGNPARLEQVIRNLLDSSLKYTPSGGRVRLTVERAGSEAILRVADTRRGHSRRSARSHLRRKPRPILSRKSRRSSPTWPSSTSGCRAWTVTGSPQALRERPPASPLRL